MQIRIRKPGTMELSYLLSRGTTLSPPLRWSLRQTCWRDAWRPTPSAWWLASPRTAFCPCTQETGPSFLLAHTLEASVRFSIFWVIVIFTPQSLYGKATWWQIKNYLRKLLIFGVHIAAKCSLRIYMLSIFFRTNFLGRFWAHFKSHEISLFCWLFRYCTVRYSI